MRAYDYCGACVLKDHSAGYFVPERHDDATLLRFLRARKFDLVKAKQMLIAAEEWRKSFGVDDIVQYVTGTGSGGVFVFH